MRQNNIFVLVILGGILYWANCCPNECQQCVAYSSNCDICKQGFQKSENDCLKCARPYQTCSTVAINCEACVDTTNQVILTCACNIGYVKNPSTYLCEICPSNCKACSSTTICTQCNDTYWLNENLCNPCIKPCANCSSNDSCSIADLYN